MKSNISDSRSIEGVKVLFSCRKCHTIFSANLSDVEYGEEGYCTSACPGCSTVSCRRMSDEEIILFKMGYVKAE